ncbi:hypothetical protein [Pollutibacter soli]|uniref:hypothetical protein n=1 Tax=Pollutibacter soli TaxID=3034157 RepID=UPI0030138F86
MKEQEKLIKENESPVPLPASDEAWSAMRRLLDEHQPEKSIPVYTESGSSGSAKKWLAVAILFFISSLVTYQLLRPADGKRSQTNHDPSKKSGSEIKSEKHNADFGMINGKKDQSLSSSGVDTNEQSNLSEKEDRLGKQKVPVKTKTGSTNKGGKHGRKSIGENTSGDKTVIPGDETMAKVDDNSTTKVENNTGRVTAMDNIAQKKTNEKSKDSATAANASEQKIDEPVDDWRFAGGLFWTLPLNAISDYETWSAGPNGKPQPYRILLPGIWLEAKHERHLMTVELNPFAYGIPKQKAFKYVEGSQPGADTLLKTYTSHTMLKSFGASLGMGYQYNINSKLWLGGGFQAIVWTRAVEQEGIVYEKIPSNSNPSVFTAESFTYPMKENWEYFSKFQLNLNADLTYREKNWQTGIRTGISVSPFAQKDGPAHPFSASLFFRWRLFYLEKKVADKE